jgi:hypothetical protein
MKKLILSLVAMALFITVKSQRILVVNDNDNITYNTDTFLHGMDQSMYNSYTYWSVPDSAGATPSTSFLNTFDVVIWYCSTDGVGLSFWQDTSFVNPALSAYVAGGGGLWVIGLDVLYNAYGAAGATFLAGEFTHDYMGLASYDKQSYADDFNVGVPQMNRSAGVSATYFPDSLLWIFPTLWYADACTPTAGTKAIYEMGPSSYLFAGLKSMFLHQNTSANINVLSTFFDPALIDEQAHLVKFIEGSIHELYVTTGISGQPNHLPSLLVYPNPVSDKMMVDITGYEIDQLQVVNSEGKTVKVMTVQPRQTMATIDVAEMAAGTYFVQLLKNHQATNQVKVLVQH